MSRPPPGSIQDEMEAVPYTWPCPYGCADFGSNHYVQVLTGLELCPIHGKREEESKSDEQLTLETRNLMENEMNAQANISKHDSNMTKLLIIGGAIAALCTLAFLGEALADEYEKPDFGEVCNAYLNGCPAGTKNLNGRVSDAIALSTAADSRIADGSADLNLDFNIMTTGDSAGFGGAAFVNLNDLLGVPLHIGPRGAVGTGGDFVVGIGASYSLKDLF